MSVVDEVYLDRYVGPHPGDDIWVDWSVVRVPLGERILDSLRVAADAAWQLAGQALAVVLLVALLPVLVAVALGIKVVSPGPALFKQVRVGQDGRRFVMWKFRSMHTQAEQELRRLRQHDEHDGLLFKIRNDPRIHPLGRWLRRFSLDELPQLWNVVRGDMTLVGPRPALPDEVARYNQLEALRLRVKPGLTGLWQVSGRSDLSWDASVALDLHYVDFRSVLLDVRIIARTFGAVVTGRGAY
jgi:lipopolysaccharide/colanic/teichoic acid biosynthesis glycosyltransferase